MIKTIVKVGDEYMETSIEQLMFSSRRCVFKEIQLNEDSHFIYGKEVIQNLTEVNEVSNEMYFLSGLTSFYPFFDHYEGVRSFVQTRATGFIKARIVSCSLFSTGIGLIYLGRVHGIDAFLVSSPNSDRVLIHDESCSLLNYCSVIGENYISVSRGGVFRFGDSGSKSKNETWTNLNRYNNIRITPTHISLPVKSFIVTILNIKLLSTTPKSAKIIPQQVIDDTLNKLTSGVYDKYVHKGNGRFGIQAHINDEGISSEKIEYICYGPTFNGSGLNSGLKNPNIAFFVGVIDEKYSESDHMQMWYEYIYNNPLCRSVMVTPKMHRGIFLIRLDAPWALTKFTAMAIRNGWEYKDSIKFKKYIDKGVDPDSAFLLSVFMGNLESGERLCKIFNYSQSIFNALSYIGTYDNFMSGVVNKQEMLPKRISYGNSRAINYVEMCRLFTDKPKSCEIRLNTYWENNCSLLKKDETIKDFVSGFVKIMRGQ